MPLRVASGTGARLGPNAVFAPSASRRAAKRLLEGVRCLTARVGAVVDHDDRHDLADRGRGEDLLRREEAVQPWIPSSVS